jgi:hypothetical protein
MAYTANTQDPYLASLSGAPQPLTPTQSAINATGNTIAPTNALEQYQYQLGQYQLGQVNPNLQASQTYNSTMAGYQQGQLGITAQQQGIQRTGLGQQGVLSQQQQSIEQQQYGLQQQQFPEQQAEAALNYQNAMKNLTDSGAASGTSTTQGQQRAVGTENQQYQWQVQDINRAQQQSQLGQQSEEAGFTYSQEQLANASQNLDLIAKANGMSQDQVMTMLNYGNQQQGQGAVQDVLGILSGQAQAGVTGLQNVGATLSSLGFSSGINTQPGAAVP